jgi:hypothetical protein
MYLFMYMCACMHLSVHVCVYVCTQNTYIHVCRIGIHAHKHIHTHMQDKFAMTAETKKLIGDMASVLQLNPTIDADGKKVCMYVCIYVHIHTV